MKIPSYSLLLTALLAVPSVRADVALNAPGVPVGSQSATASPFRNVVTLSNSYRFVFSGTQAQGTTTAAPGSSGTNQQGQYSGQWTDTQGSTSNGIEILLKAFVSAANSGSPQAGAVQLRFRDIQTFNSRALQTLTLSPAAVFVGTTAPINVQLVWQGEGSGRKPTGFFNILGEFQKAPPIPTGTLTFPYGEWQLKTSASTNPDPQGTVTIVRQ